FSLPGLQPEDRADSGGKNNDEHLNDLSLAQIVILLQFLVGVSVNQPVGYLLLLALLQFIITIPGFFSYFTRKRAHYYSYVAFQVVTFVSEVIWLIYSIDTGTHTGISVTTLAILIFVQTLAILAATLFKNVVINLQSLSISRNRPYDNGNAESPEEGNTKSSAGSPRSIIAKKSVSSVRDGDQIPVDVPEPRSLRPRRMSKDTEQGIDQSTRGIYPGRKKKRSVSKDSLRKFKESRRKMRKLAKQLKEMISGQESVREH
ncbi:hypothetical protein OESDEN_13867, partial [Oesophagostomum dentatum]